MTERIFGYIFKDGEYVINPLEAEAIRDYYDNFDSYFGNIAAYKEKWHDVIAAFIEEIDDHNVDITEMIKKSSLIPKSGTTEGHNRIVDEDTWNRVQAIVKSRK